MLNTADTIFHFACSNWLILIKLLKPGDGHAFPFLDATTNPLLRPLTHRSNVFELDAEGLFYLSCGSSMEPLLHLKHLFVHAVTDKELGVSININGQL